MRAYAGRTGLDGDGDPGRRYLWTDAHAVCNFLSLAEASGDEGYRDLAERLVDRVHAVLGRHRDDDGREGWISGLDEERGRRHPTAGGLRIGKALNERAPGEHYVPSMEWDRDGQYFHYLTKWMHALSRVSAATGDADYLRWAIELAVAAYDGFRVRDPVTGREFLAWKMRIDLSEPLVPSTGLHDPLDGYVTARELEFRANALDDGQETAALAAARDGMEKMLARDWPPTNDPLGIGGMLFDAARLARLAAERSAKLEPITASVTASAVAGLEAFAASDALHLPAEGRLAFRELGLSIGLHGAEAIRGIVGGSAGTVLERHQSLADAIERFWLQPANQAAHTWEEHLDINAVMLATSLLPGQFLQI